MFFGGKKLVKSDKLVLLIDGKFLNLIILVIYISVVSIENWLQVTHNHRQKTLKGVHCSPIIATLAC